MKDTEGGEGIRPAAATAHKGPISSHTGQPSRLNLGWGNRWIGKGDETNMWALLVTKTIYIPSHDYPFPDEPNKSWVRYRPGLQSLGYKRQ
jgi:hypothetical protein